MNRENNFDILRLAAATQVMLAHGTASLHYSFPPVVMRIYTLFPGVAIFFFISGFLVTQSFVERGGPLRYFRARALRIYPGLALNLLFIAALCAAVGDLTAPGWVFHSTLLLTGELSWAGDKFGSPYTWKFFAGYPSGVLWTLTAELSFYLVVPILTFLLRPLGRWVRLTAIAAIIVGSYQYKIWALRDVGNPNVYFLGPELLNVSCLGYLWVFGIGIAAYWEREFLTRFIKGKFLMLLGLYIVVALGILALRTKPNFAFGLTWPLHWSDAIIIALLGLLTFSAAFGRRQIASWLHGNDISYGVYLYHMPVFLWFERSGWTGSLPQAVVAVATALVLSFLSWRLVEKNCLKLKFGRTPAKAPVH